MKERIPEPVKKLLRPVLNPFLPKWRAPTPDLPIEGTALIVVGMINEAVEGCVDEFAFIANVQRLVAHCREKGLHIVHTKSVHSPDDRSDWTLCMLGDPESVGFMEGSWENQWAAGCEPREGEHVLLRNRYSAFHRTTLAADLRAHGIERVIIVGTHSEFCIHYSVIDAYEFNFPCYVPQECSGSLSKMWHKRTMEFFDLHAYIYPVKLEWVLEQLQ